MSTPRMHPWTVTRQRQGAGNAADASSELAPVADPYGDTYVTADGYKLQVGFYAADPWVLYAPDGTVIKRPHTIKAARYFITQHRTGSAPRYLNQPPRRRSA